MTVIRREAIDAGLRIYSKMESDDPDESPLEVALRVAVDTAIARLARQHEGAVDLLRRAEPYVREARTESGVTKATALADEIVALLTTTGGQSDGFPRLEQTGETDEA
jgi:hypothetical protein